MRDRELTHGVGTLAKRATCGESASNRRASLAVGYAEETATLEIEFSGGSVHRYFAVQKSAYDKLTVRVSRRKPQSQFES